MFNKDEKIHKQSIKKIDALVTWLLLWGVVASIYGIKKTNKYLDKQQKQEGGTKNGSIKKILKMLIFWYPEPLPVVEKKKSFFERLFKK